MKSKTNLFLGAVLFLGAFLLSVLFKFDNKILLIVTGLGSLGALTNVFVVSMNNGKMPIILTPKETPTFKDKNYCVAHDETRYVWLIDRFRLFGVYSFSIGDLLMAVSLLGILLVIAL